jgi:tetratricopeptide (TPR) repeat protein
MKPSAIKHLPALGVTMLLALGAGAFAAGGLGDDSSKDPNSGSWSDKGKAKTDLTTCPAGQVWSAKRKKCLKRKAEVLPDGELTEYAYALAKADRFAEAIEVLDSLRNPDTPRALNYRGYATRKMGRTEDGIKYYLKSIDLDPTYAQVREYLGEAYVLQGKIEAAKAQLGAIAWICGSTRCAEYEDLAFAIAHPGQSKT